MSKNLKVTDRDWILKLLQENNFCNSKVYEYYEEGVKSGKIFCNRESFFRTVRLTNADNDNDIIKENISYKKQVQKYQDLNRIQNKSFREQARLENALEELSREIVSSLKKYDLTGITIEHKQNDCKATGILQLSDTHFNELISSEHNVFDFNVAAKRLKKFVMQAKKYFNSVKIKHILLACSGDILNADRLQDQLLNSSTNRADACVLAFYLLKQVILDLNKDYDVSICVVSGNESRIKDEMGWSDIIVRDNYDFTIENFLKVQFADCKGIYFVSGNPFEKVVSVSGQNVLITHGLGLEKDTQRSIQQKIGQYALKGIVISYIIYGHVHCASLSDHSSRSSSLAGSNSYNERALHLMGRASQNIYIFYEDGNRDAIKIDLQNVDGIEGYNIIKELEAYNAKSASKVYKNKGIYKVE